MSLNNTKQEVCTEILETRASVFIYMVKFKGFEVLKIGWSTDPCRRCRNLGGSKLEVEDLVCVKMYGNRSNIQYVEAMFHKALREFSIDKNKSIPTWEGCTEYYSLKAWGGFYNICKALSLDVIVLR